MLHKIHVYSTTYSQYWVAEETFLFVQLISGVGPVKLYAEQGNAPPVS